MSQRDVYEILKEIGGKATTNEIRNLAKNKYPNRTLYQYVSDRLKKLQKWGYVEKEGEYWVIKKPMK
jgi:DNA-binding HxlR family transcriptional regulator